MYNKNPFSTQKPDGPFRRGLFKYVVLQYLKDQPSHGYEIIQALTRRFHGLYVPSPGTVYPRLQRLTEMGLVTFAEEEGGRKVYSITRDGLQFLAEHSELEKAINERLNDWENPENIDDIRKTMREFGKLGEMLSWEIRRMSPEQLRRVRDALYRTHEDIEDILEK